MTAVGLVICISRSSTLPSLVSLMSAGGLGGLGVGARRPVPAPCLHRPDHVHPPEREQHVPLLRTPHPPPAPPTSILMVPLGPRLVFITSYRPLAAAGEHRRASPAPVTERRQRRRQPHGGGWGPKRLIAQALGAPSHPLTCSAAHGQCGRAAEHLGLRIQLPDRRHASRALVGCPADGLV